MKNERYVIGGLSTGGIHVFDFYNINNPIDVY